MNASTLSLRIKDNLNFLTKKFNITEAELSRQAQLPQATLNRLLKGATDDPRASTLKAIAEFFNITVDQLFSEKLIKESNFEITHIPIYHINETFALPKNLPKNLDIKKYLSKKEEHFIEVEPSISSNCIAFEVKGESMWPQFIEETIIIVDTTLSPKHRNFVLYFINDDQQIVLRQYINEDNNKILKPINYAYKNIQISNKDIYIGTVIQSKNDFRKSK